MQPITLDLLNSIAAAAADAKAPDGTGVPELVKRVIDAETRVASPLAAVLGTLFPLARDNQTGQDYVIVSETIIPEGAAVPNGTLLPLWPTQHGATHPVAVFCATCSQSKRGRALTMMIAKAIDESEQQTQQTAEESFAEIATACFSPIYSGEQLERVLDMVTPDMAGVLTAVARRSLVIDCRAAPSKS